MRRIPSLLVIGICLMAFGSCSGPVKDEAPRAVAREHRLETHGDVRVDEYYWLRERENPEVIAHLEAENAWTASKMAHTEALQEEIFGEITGRIDPTAESAPELYDGWYYYERYEEGREYAVNCRRHALDSPEQIILDENELDDGGYLAVRGLEVNSDGTVLVYAVDRDGRRKYTLHFKDLDGDRVFAETIADVTGNVAWAEDGVTLFYGRQDPQTLRSHQVWRHRLGSAPETDVLVYEEMDETYSCYVGKSRSREYLSIFSRQTLSTEYRFLPADEPLGEWRVLQPRQRDLEYSVDHLGDSFYIRTNHEASNFRLMRTPTGATGLENWTEVIGHREDVLLEGFAVFTDRLVLNERSVGLNRLRVLGYDGSDDHYIDFGEPTYSVWLAGNHEIDADLVRYEFESLSTPESTFDYDPRARERTLIRQERVLGGFEVSHYRSERLWAEARDGTRVPISLVYRQGTRDAGVAPLLLYAYGSYGSSNDAWFSPARVSLLDRGFVFAIAHVRGGEELGRQWYEDGKLLKKMNTFTDFVDCADHLIAAGYTDPAHLFAEGGSAGGLLMGVVVNIAADRFRGVIADVPFVDVVTTMLDETIPLTTSEYDEWGNPNDRQYYDYMLSYSPYDQVAAADYPNLLVTTGLHDSQVQYWEPAKWVAKLRAKKTDDNLLLLKTNMDAGHGGQSGRFRRFRETALAYAFMLDLRP